jgi:hypothetical protein
LNAYDAAMQSLLPYLPAGSVQRDEWYHDKNDPVYMAGDLVLPPSDAAPEQRPTPAADSGTVSLRRMLLSPGGFPHPIISQLVDAALLGNAVLHFSLENQRIPALLAPGLLAAQASLAQLQGFPASKNAIQRCLLGRGGGAVDASQPQDAAHGQAGGADGGPAGYSIPDDYARDKWIYEQRIAGRTNPEIIDALRDNKNRWTPLYSDDSIRDALKRYCLYHGLPVPQGRRGRPTTKTGKPRKPPSKNPH